MALAQQVRIWQVFAPVIDIIPGTVFWSIGLTAWAIAAIRWRRGVRILVGWGIGSGMYGLQTLGPYARHLDGFAARPSICYALREYSSHAFGPGFRLVRLAGAEPDDITLIVLDIAQTPLQRT